MKQIAEYLGMDSPDNIRIWNLTSRFNNTIRPLTCIECTNENSLKILTEMTKSDTAWNIFVETANDLSFSKNFDYLSLLNTTATNKLQYPQASPTFLISPPSPRTSGGGLLSSSNILPSFNSKEDVMILFKYYEPKNSTLRYVFRMHLPINLKLKTMQLKINKKMKFAPNTELLFYEEVKISQITPLVARDVSLEQLAHEQLLDGDIYVFQINEKEKFQNYKLPLVPDYFK
jgi:hypothetical protein